MMKKLLPALVFLALSCEPALANDTVEDEQGIECMDYAFACVTMTCSQVSDVCSSRYDRTKCLRCIATARAGVLCKHFESKCDCPAKGQND